MRTGWMGEGCVFADYELRGPCTIQFCSLEFFFLFLHVMFSSGCHARVVVMVVVVAWEGGGTMKSSQARSLS